MAANQGGGGGDHHLLKTSLGLDGRHDLFDPPLPAAARAHGGAAHSHRGGSRGAVAATRARRRRARLERPGWCSHEAWSGAELLRPEIHPGGPRTPPSVRLRAAGSTV